MTNALENFRKCIHRPHRHLVAGAAILTAMWGGYVGCQHWARAQPAAATAARNSTWWSSQLWKAYLSGYPLDDAWGMLKGAFEARGRSASPDWRRCRDRETTATWLSQPAAGSSAE